MQTLSECQPWIERAGSEYDKALFAFFASFVHPAFDRDLEADLSLLRRVGDPWLTGGFLNTLGELARERGDLAAARVYYEEAIDLRGPVGGRAGGRAWVSFVNVAYIDLMEGDLKAAVPSLQLAIRNVLDDKTLYGASAVLLGASLLATLTGDPGLGLRMLGAADAINTAIGIDQHGPDALVRQRGLELLWEAVGKQAANRQLKAGPAASADAALDEAGELFTRMALLQQREDAKTKRPGGLSGQEFEVLRLVASGDTNREIAAKLVLSVRTVENHIANATARSAPGDEQKRHLGNRQWSGFHCQPRT